MTEPDMGMEMETQTGATVSVGSHRLAEWALWCSGIVGVFLAAAFAGVTSVMAHGEGADATFDDALSVRLVAYALPPLIHVASIAAAIGLARGRAWSVTLARGVSVVLIAGLPLALISPTGSVPWILGEDWLLLLVRQHVFGALFIPQVAHAALGAVALAALLRTRPNHDVAAPQDRRFRGASVAGLIIAAEGVLPAVGVIAAVVLAADRGHAAGLVTASLVLAGVGALVGWAVATTRRWAVPASPPALLGLGFWAYATAAAGLGALLSGREIVDGPDPFVLALSWGGALGFGLLGLALLATVVRARRRFVWP